MNTFKMYKRSGTITQILSPKLHLFFYAGTITNKWFISLLHCYLQQPKHRCSSSRLLYVTSEQALQKSSLHFVHVTMQ